MLKKLLDFNAVFSIINAVIMLAATQQIADLLFSAGFTLFGMSAAFVLQVLAIGLLLFAAYVGFVAYILPKHVAQVKIIILADWLWVASTILLFIFTTDIFSNTGLGFFAIVSLIVAGFALKQTKHLKA